MFKRILFSSFMVLALLACGGGDKGKLPVYGPREVKNVTYDGGMKADTIYHKIPDFAFLNQDSTWITHKSVANKIYVADFFFTSCPTICPVMKTQMLRVYEKFNDNTSVMLLSHTIDPEYDDVPLLHDYAERLGVSSNTWNFLTGDKEIIYEIGQKSYMVTAAEDSDEPGGYIHSGAFLLVDPERRIRGIYDGTKEKEVDRLIKDIPKLLSEYGL
ncbi:MAG: SCO family protein [Cyclobacteriaceae bacterium]|nr:SCO family protein [Cyclobacteriaceae bacterium]